MFSRRSAILTAIGGLFSGLFGGISWGRQKSDPPADDGEILTPAQRKAKLRNWFKKHTASCDPVGCGLVVGGSWRITGELLFENGTKRQIGVGRDPDETEEMASEFRSEFRKNAMLFCPSLSVMIGNALASDPECIVTIA